MKNKIAILDASPLIALAYIKKLYLLNALFNDFVVPQSVAKEITKRGKPYSQELSDFIKGKIVSSKNKELVELFAVNLDSGESEVLALYYEINNAIVVIDEEKARKLAKRKNIPLIGSLGLLVLAKYHGHISKVKEMMDLLIKNGIRIKPYVYNEILKMCNEL